MTTPLEIERLKQELFEATETLRAIREGEVDAFVLQSSGLYRVAALSGADSPYRVLVESMRDGALTVAASGEVLYCNRPFCETVGASQAEVIGHPVMDWFELEGGIAALLGASQVGEAAASATLRARAGPLPVSLNACALPSEDQSTVFCLLVTDLTDRVAAQRLRAQQALLSRQRAELEAILKCLPFALLLSEKSGVPSYVNPTAERLLEQHPDLQGRAAELAGRVLAGASVEAAEVLLPSTKGTESAFRVDAIELGEEDLPARALVVIENVTAAHDALRERERQEQFREAFVGILGHDLRSPLMAIAAAVETLRHTRDAERAERATAVISRSTLRMSRLIDDMLDLTLSRIGGGIPVQRASMDLEQVARAAIDEVRATKPSARIELAVSGNPRGEWDAARLGQVLTNLLSNALEHSSGPEPISVWIDGSNPESVCLLVENHGETIPAELLPNIFDPFRRGERHKRGGGIGLGLYIAEQIVAAHGGTIGVRSHPGEPTVFRVELSRTAPARAH